MPDDSDNPENTQLEPAAFDPELTEEVDNEALNQLQEAAESHQPSRKRFLATPLARRMKWATITFFIAGSLALPISPFVLPTMVRWRILGRISSTDEAKRRQALAIAIHKSLEEGDQNYADGVLRRVHHPSRDVFIDVHQALVALKLWSRERVGEDAFFRWIDILLTEKKDARQAAALELCQEPNALQHPEIIKRLKTLANDPEADVKFELLFRLTSSLSEHLMSIHKHPEGPLTAVQIISQLSQDKDQDTARLAWMYLGLLSQLDKAPAFSQKVKDVIRTQTDRSIENKSDAVDETAQWARLIAGIKYDDASQTNPIAPIGNAFVIAGMSTPDAHRLIAHITDATRNQKLDDTTRLQLWHAVLSLPPEQSKYSLSTIRQLVGYLLLQDMDLAKGPQAMLIKATYHQIGGVLSHWDDTSLPELDWLLPFLHTEEMRIAILEGFDPQSEHATKVFTKSLASAPGQLTSPSALRRLLQIRLLPGKHDMITTSDRDLLIDLASSEEATWRDITASILANNLTAADASKLSGWWMRDLNDEVKMTGAMLAALAGVSPQAQYQDKYKQETVDLTVHIGTYQNPRIKKIAKLARWLKARPQVKQQDIPTDREIKHWLYQHDDRLTSTVLLAILQPGKDPILAMDYLFNPLGHKIDEPIDLYDLLIKRRWWWALKAHLPTDLLSKPPQLSLWADEATQTLQIQLLREWYLINRATWRKSLYKSPTK